MKSIFKEQYYLALENHDISRASESEIKYYFEEIFGTSGDNLEFKDSELKGGDHPKFDYTVFTFMYKGIYFVKVFSAPGEDAFKSDNGSLIVNVFVFDSPNSKQYVSSTHNAFYNDATKKVEYDPVIRNGKRMLEYVKSVLSDDDDDKEYVPPTPDFSPKGKNIKDKDLQLA